MKTLDVCCALIEDLSGNTPMLWVAQKPSSSHLAGLWEFPGGKMEPGETGKETIIREIGEELGSLIIVSDQCQLPPVIHDYGTHCIRLIPFICRFSNPDILPRPFEHAALALLTLSRIDNIRLAPADIPLFLSYKDMKRES